ncbi:hypothetical protein mru_2202 [Methanobrevibacter ruminantium M1]|uniref:Uncharacterized protein n=1 Tax=Methanobrevibacter ruminantium (strain ATCC 35063 / DSM 1093 / JCM 13430 / OCM 146 / M1) TaxID=634498 RepID=D3E1G7_METRM|nr:hypothetical protein [Methanobrevibacter ruminantium]ADC48052.1 hypothetical protein mru_2202 [Methanobrevibacter ruminantium M1]
MTIKKYFKTRKGTKKSVQERDYDSDYSNKGLHKESRIKNLLNDNKGNYSIVISAILLISFLILSIIVLNTVLEEREEHTDTIASNQYQYIIEDYKRNLPNIEREALEELSLYVIENKRPCFNSRDDLKEIIDEKLAQKNQEYYQNYNIEINSSIIGIENTSDPFSYKFKTYISSVKGDFSYEEIDESYVNCYNLKDPVPVLFCGDDSSFRIEDYSLLGDSDFGTHDSNFENDDSSSNQKVFYGHSLAKFLRRHHVENYSFYENASSPFIIKRCPYDPYKHHGDDNGRIMKNCRDNGYYHESADGACYLCRLEGKSGCDHYGFETFINPQKTNETGGVSACGSDHVIFSDDIYPGVEVIYNSENGLNEILYLDPHGHKVKYGMSEY